MENRYRNMKLTLILSAMLTLPALSTAQGYVQRYNARNRSFVLSVKSGTSIQWDLIISFPNTPFYHFYAINNQYANLHKNNRYYIINNDFAS